MTAGPVLLTGPGSATATTAATVAATAAATAAAVPVLRIALVNNMPDAALIETEEQFLGLLAAGVPAGRTVAVRRYRLDGITRAPEASAHVAAGYDGPEALYAAGADAVVVTGTEPSAGALREEAYWLDLAQLLDWSRAHTRSVLLSCLAAHAALDALHGAPRQRLPGKLTGVIEQQVAPGDPLVVGLPARTAFPHSRFNEVPTAQVQAAGYRILMADPATGWTLAAADHEHCLVVLVQGHPEYGADSLLREYRRDARRYLTGEHADYPTIPAGYVDDWSRGALETFAARARVWRHAELMNWFPHAAVAARLDARWAAPSQQLFANWLAEVSRREPAALRSRHA